MVASLISPDIGMILFEGQVILTTLSPEAYRQQVSYCAQTPALFGDTVYDKPEFFPGKFAISARSRQPSQTIWRVLNCRIRFCKNRLPRFPAGKNQRIALIRNLQFLPKILLLDEITSAAG
ncbi:ABC transporter ATP-binding protein [Salmonella enterica subsp. enterica]|uniref:ABC transporter ATP-binding protein n=1 Tax=Salmonella enterica I TaxID=59201 RepID=A0A447U899_SALET|nr:ABC transporter ATP-binding protein [Salmonella enterica subsp. enterica]